MAISGSTKMIRKRVAEGLCGTCKQPNSSGTTRCRACTTRAVAGNKRIKDAVRAAGKCVECQALWTGLTRRCDTCKAAQRAKWDLRANSSEHCARCAAPKDSKHVACAACRAEMRVTSNRRRNGFHAAGQCVQCGSPRDTKKKFCSQCILNTAARRWLGDSGRANELRQLLIRQDFRCAYTGEKLEVGGNASVDHIHLRIKGGADEISNLQWVTWTVNRSKSAMTHREFLDMCRKVVECHGL
jgi:hypothetical protein